ncbi:selenocysteine-specific translation elongation factor [Methanomicrobium sp. W14]|uniref:EF-Tu/IF-2/RF-3 family GTPase n=1 Tax=Methanomicrobium sp. W14 TaxID=2817839 RepID=UPI001AE74B28|nr:EF-Tu/IF-2/RF-3 family GTPase [Methanomicrobium sp. W14]MBP2132118.1 selenocysteine-specific translation elongation factor [Methanomicrobium sp. W14]
MPNLNVAMLGTAGYAKNVGKKGTSSDIVFYNLKKGEDTLTMIEPQRYPERLAPLFYSISATDCAVIVVDSVSPEFGETIVALDCANVKKGYVILRNYLDKSQIEPLIRGTVIENYSFIEDDPNVLREKLFEDAAKKPHEVTEEPGIVPVDHHFNVKGIGTVVLGNVISGTIRTHDNLKVLPTQKTALVRSIQKHDADCPDASGGDRVGLALKNITSEELDRGYVLTARGDVKTGDEFTGKLNMVKFWQTPVAEGMVIHVGHWMQYISGKIESVSKDPKNPDISISLEKELVYLQNDIALVFHLDAGKLRVVGTISLN